MTSSLRPGQVFLLNAAQTHFRKVFEDPPFATDQKLNEKLRWNPPLRFDLNNHLTVLSEPSEESVYPQILRLRYAALLSVHEPISVYSVCPIEVANHPSQVDEIADLEAHGFGLLTVDSKGHVTRRLTAIPIIQHISAEEFRSKMRGLPKPIRRRIAETFDAYKTKPTSGVSEMAELVEGLILRAGRDSVKKSFLKPSEAKPGFSATTLDALMIHASTKAQNAAWGSARGYIAQWRNTAHHFPANKKQAAKKYTDCRHGFLDGIGQVQTVAGACKKVGLSGGLPK